MNTKDEYCRGIRLFDVIRDETHRKESIATAMAIYRLEIELSK